MNELIIVRGGGDLATGTVHRLWQAGFPVLVLETAMPAAIRRQVAISEAVYQGSVTIEGMTGQLIHHLDELNTVWAADRVPVLVDEDCACLKNLKPLALVDGILAKKNLGTARSMAPLTIALGPGFVAGEDVDIVIETYRGHSLGRVITSGAAKPNTGIPGVVGGYGRERVIYAPAAGVMRNVHEIGDVVELGEIIAWVEAADQRVAVPAPFTGLLRGLIRDGYPVTEGFKIADVDPRAEERENCFLISDKSRCIAGSVLEQVCAYVRKIK